MLGICDAELVDIYLREKFPVYLVMAGLYENISNLQNEKTLTFLYRAPRIFLKPLNLISITQNYRQVFHIPMDEAAQMARETKGYPFAFQVLGHIRWDHPDKPIEDLMPLFDEKLSRDVYIKIWTELSSRDGQYDVSITSAYRISR